MTRLGIAGRVLPMTVVICALGTGCGSPNAPTRSMVTAPSPTPPIAPPVLPSLIGTVVERTPQGERPLSGAFVWGQFHGGSMLGQVRADEFGRYELWGLAPGATLQVMATKGWVLSAVRGRDHGWGNTASRPTAGCGGEFVVVEELCTAFATEISHRGGCCVRTYHSRPAGSRQQIRVLRTGIRSRGSNENRRSRPVPDLRFTAVAHSLDLRSFRWCSHGPARR